LRLSVCVEWFRASGRPNFVFSSAPMILRVNFLVRASCNSCPTPRQAHLRDILCGGLFLGHS
jgi:hypothetical protein